MLRKITAVAAFTASVSLAPPAHAADREIAFRPLDKTTMEMTWKAYQGEKFRVCVKPDGASGDICGGKNTVYDQWPVASPYMSWDRNTGRMAITIQLPQCGKYKVRLKLSALSFETKEFYLPC